MSVADIVIIDGMNVFLRQWAANPYTDVNGNNVGGLVGTLRLIKNVISLTSCKTVVVAWDGNGGSRRRRSIYAEYKSGRKPKVNRQHDIDSPDEARKNLDYQKQRLEKYLSYLGILQINCDDIEADDIIAYLCLLHEDKNKIIVSSDNDFLQLVNNNTLIYSPIKKCFISQQDVVKDINCLPENFILMKSICGDKSDNIKGIKNLGPKTIVKFFPELAVRQITLSELFVMAKSVSPKGIREKKLVEELLSSCELVMTNYKLMSLSNPLISVNSCYSIKNQFSAQIFPSITNCKLLFVKDGIQIMDKDFFSTYAQYNARHKEN